MTEEPTPKNLIGQKILNIDIPVFYKNKIEKHNPIDYSGNWLILFFYPADFTFVCPTELEELADMYDEFTKKGAEILSISTDKAFTHKAWHDKSPAISKVKFPMGADPTGQLTKSLGVYDEENGVALRATFIVNPKGIIKAYMVNGDEIGRSAKELHRLLVAAQFVENNKGKVCPASWEEGDDALTPGVDLVGKI